MSRDSIPTREETEEWVLRLSKKQMCLPLPKDFDTYWNCIVAKDVRTQWRKARKSGIEAVWTTAPQGIDIGEIWNSWESKQDRPINKIIDSPSKALGSWDIDICWPFTYYPHTVGYIDFLEARDEDARTVAYIELGSAGKTTMVMSTLGHAIYLRLGVMRFTFVEAIRRLIERGQERLYYMKPEYLALHPERRFFAEDLGFRREE